MIWSTKGGPDPIWDLTFHKADKNFVWCAGVKACQYFDINGQDKKKGAFGSHKRTSFAAITADD